MQFWDSRVGASEYILDPWTKSLWARPHIIIQNTKNRKKMKRYICHWFVLYSLSRAGPVMKNIWARRYPGQMRASGPVTNAGRWDLTKSQIIQNTKYKIQGRSETIWCHWTEKIQSMKNIAFSCRDTVVVILSVKCKTQNRKGRVGINDGRRWTLDQNPG